MTKTEAQDIITKAIAAEGPITGTLSIDAFAQRTATALEALGLLEFAHVATQQQLAELNRIIDPASGAKAPSPEVNSLVPDDVTAARAANTWAQTRQRS